MPANPATLDLEQDYADRLKVLAERTVVQVADRYQGINPEALDLSFRRFLPAAATIIETGQVLAQQAAIDFHARQHFLELGQVHVPERPDRGIAGTTIDGRAIQAALASVPPAVLVSLKQGRSMPFALARGLHVATRMAATETADAARRETDHQMRAFPRVYGGWQWVARGTCAVCLAKMNNHTYGNSEKPQPLNGHPGCTCIKSTTLYKAQNTVERMTGAMKFNALSEDAQAALFKSMGKEKARAIREGRLTLDDLVDQQRMKQWRSMLQEKGKMPTLHKAPTVDDDIAKLDDMLAAHRTRVAAHLGEEGARKVDEAAEAIVARATAAAPQITDDVTAAGAKAGAKMEGLDYRIKTQPSMARKIGSDMMADGTDDVAKVTDDIGDSVRFTMTFEPEDYWRGVDAAVDDMLARGYVPYKWKDYWGGDYYRGVNSNWIAPDGTKIEVQFHTPRSFDIKEFKQHKFYETHRISDDIIQMDRLEAHMGAFWDDVTLPPGARISNLDDILARPAAKVPTIEDDLAKLKALEQAHRDRVAQLLGKEGLAQVDDATQAVVAAAARAEPAITDAVQATARRTDAVMKGLDFRVKSASSMARKIGSDVITDGKPVAQAADDIGDAVRYTMTWEPGRYWTGVDQAVDDLLAQGYTPYKWKDFWDGTIYRGINSNWRSPDGTQLEIQFHTVRSYAQKEAQHELYEAARISTNAAQIARLEAAMASAWDDITLPRGARISNLDDILERAGAGGESADDVMEAEARAYRFLTDHEEASVVSPDGRVLFRENTGEARAVHFDVLQLALLEDNILIHNHPGWFDQGLEWSTSFSPDDARLALTQGLREIRAVGKGADYFLSFKSGAGLEPMTEAELTEYIDVLNRAVRADLTPKVAGGQVSIAEAERDHWHLVWTALAEMDERLVYRRELRPDLASP